MLLLELIKLGFNARLRVLHSASCGGDAQERDRVFVNAWSDTHSRAGGDFKNLPNVFGNRAC